MTCGKTTTEMGRIMGGSSLLLNMRGRKRLAGDRDIWRRILKSPGKDDGCRAIKNKKKKKILPTYQVHFVRILINSEITDGRCNVL
jgi:hypothetical protein